MKRFNDEDQNRSGDRRRYVSYNYNPRCRCERMRTSDCSQVPPSVPIQVTDNIRKRFNDEDPNRSGDRRRYAPYDPTPRCRCEPTRTADCSQVAPSVPIQGTSRQATEVANPPWFEEFPPLERYSGEICENCGHQSEYRVKRQNENELSKKRWEAYQKQRGLEPGNHVIAQILQTIPNAVPSKQGTSGEPIQSNAVPSKQGTSGEPIQSNAVPSKQGTSGEPIQSNAVPSKQGTSGEPIQLVANYFKILKEPTWQLYLYRVDITPDIALDIASEFRRQKYRNLLLHCQIKKFGPYLFDGSMLYMLVKLDKDVTEFIIEETMNCRPYAIKIELMGSVSGGTYQYLHVWSLLLRKCEKTLGLHQIGRNHYNPAQKTPLHQFGIEMWLGYLTAIRQHETDLLLCVDISTKVMRTETVYEIMQRNCGSHGSYDKVLLENKLLGRTVRTSYSDKSYMIHDINFDETPEATFSLKNGEEKSYIEYFERKYGARIRYPQQPMLVVRSSQRQIRGGQSNVSQLIPEMCFVTGFDDEMRNNHHLMREVANCTRLEPGEHLKRAQGLIDRLQNTARNFQTKFETCDLFKEWNFQIDTKPVQLQGRQMPNEQILFGGQRTLHSTDWNRFHIDEMYISVHLTNWVLIYPEQKTKTTHSFLGELQRTAAGMKYNIADPYMYAIPGSKYIDYQCALEKASMRDPQLIFCILTNSDPNTYGSIKKYCIEKVAKPSQALLTRTYEWYERRCVERIATKIAIQINCKLGGVPWMVKIYLKGLMTIGFDVHHDTKSINKRSCGAMVATMDMQIKQRFFSVVTNHISGDELCNDLKMLIHQVLRQYIREHGTLPERILFYRDGVTDGQITYVKDVEITNILDGLRSLYGDRRIPLTYIVVTKRINTRLFRNIPQDSNGTCYQNPESGTVVDDVITLPERHEFFLVSQSLKKGTVSPTNYNILHNNMGLSMDRLQRLTYQMTHLYYHNCGTVAVPAVCQYAHRLAFMVGSYDLKPSNDDLQKTLYFL